MNSTGPQTELVDIRDVHVDKTLPRQERIASFIRQIKDPYHFRCGEYTIHVKFANNGATLENRLHGILR